MGLHHLVYEVVDNSVDEALAGYCTEVNVTIHIDNSVTVVDNGRGIPVDMHEEEGVSAAEVVMTKLHAGGKFDSKSYKVSGGLHGVGVSCVNALSERLELEIWREGFTWQQDIRLRRSQGAAGEAPAKRAARPAPRSPSSPTHHHGGDQFNYDTLAQRLRELAFLNKGLKITLTDERVDPEKNHEFLYSGGIAEFIKHLNRGKSVLHDKPIHFEAEREIAQRRHAVAWKSRCNTTTAIRKAVQLRQQHQHGGWRHASERLPHRAHPHHQRVRASRPGCSRTSKRT
jgi:DNA gyrase subunit B